MALILFLSPATEDYLAVTLLQGLRATYGDTVVDYPRYDVAYSDYPVPKRALVYGRGFSVFFNLAPTEIDRRDIDIRVQRGEFAVIVIADMWTLYPKFIRWRSVLDPTKTILVDGADTPQVYPYAGQWWRNPKFWLIPRAHKQYLYFKREWTSDTHFNMWHKLIPKKIRKFLPQAPNLRGISFSFPEEKIVKVLPIKSKDFARHVVDPEVAALVPGSSSDYVFNSEREYYSDLQASRFGITTKRAGWDCLRHYEIAANGCVPCFRDLETKPESCAPHGLKPGVNCLSYDTAIDLIRQIREIGPDNHMQLARAALEWASAHTTRKASENVLRELKTYNLAASQ